MSSGTKTPEILVIADQERLHGIFELSGIQCGKAFTLDEGLKSAQRRAPALLFIQSRLGGLSGEIIARHIRLELKDKKTHLVLLCNPEDMPAPGNKHFSAAIDISLPDEQLADQLRSFVGPLSAGGSPVPVRGKRKQAVRSAPDLNGRPDDKAYKGGKARVTGQEKRKSPVKVARSSMERAPVQPEPAEEMIDIVKIAGRDTAPAGPEEIIPSPAESRNSADRFREELDSAMGKTIAGKPAGKATDPGIPTPAADTRPRPAKTARSEQSSPEGINLRIKASRAVLIVSTSVVLLGISLLWLYSGTRSTPKTREIGPRTQTEGTGSDRKILPAGRHPGNVIGKPDGNGAKREPLTAKGQEPTAKPSAATEVKYLKYTVRRGDTVFTILTKRFGLSSRMAESLIPQVLEKNGISRNTVLSVGQELLIPGEVKIQPLPGTE
jgi:LysM repeat protein